MTRLPKHKQCCTHVISVYRVTSGDIDRGAYEPMDDTAGSEAPAVVAGNSVRPQSMNHHKKAEAAQH